MESDSKVQEEVYRFLQDLEFVQCLSNPFYLECILFIICKILQLMAISKTKLF